MTAQSASASRHSPTKVGVVDELHARLREWVGDVLGDVPVVLGPPAQSLASTRGICLHLLSIEAASGAQGKGKTPPLQLGMRFLVTAWSPEPLAMHNDLCELAFSAMESAGFDVDFEDLSPAIWAALEVTVRPSFCIRLSLRKARTLPPAVAVRSPLVLAAALMVSLDGIVLGPRDVPLPGARIELVSLRRATRSDARGWFSFPGVPERQPLRLRVLAHGVEQFFTVEAPGEPGQRLPLHVDRTCPE